MVNMDRITEYEDEDIMSGGDPSEHTGTSQTNGGTGEQQARAHVTDANTNRVFLRVRYAVFGLLLSVTAAVSLSVYFYSRYAEVSAFEDHFADQATKVVNSFTSNAERRLEALTGFAGHITSHALTTEETFPMVTLPDFERHATVTLRLAEVVAILIMPIVTFEQRRDWVAYSVANQRWIDEGLALQAKREAEDADTLDHLQEQFDKGQLTNETDYQQKVPPFIFKVKPGTTEATIEDGPGPYAPIWSFAPAIPAWNLVNYNSFTHPTRARELLAVVQAQKPLLSSAADFRKNDPLTANRKSVMNLFLNRWRNGTFEYEAGPVSDIYVPVWDSFGPDAKLSQVLTAYIYWQSYFTNVLPEGQNGIVAILENTCGQSFTYVLHGPHVTYIGQGDLHETKYEELVVETGSGAFLGKSKVQEEPLVAQCFYNVRVYPSSEMEDDHVTSTPLFFALGLMGMFLLTSVAFLTYDRLVSHRHTQVETKAIQSTAVVQSLFPAQVRDRLYEKTEQKKEGFLNNSKSANPHYRSGLDDNKQNIVDGSMPIADLYPECTVLFADICGFTNWSSMHTPAEVFLLLETLYATFDKIARKRGVFKVETIGDCYVAVTGLPEAQEDHAVRMAKFAAQCLTQVGPVLHSLAEKLGPETTDLSMRFGLNSGPVTAGVLRGEKARFQLFGDTVNTAARMESNGHKGRIHMSEGTADLLIMTGLDNWVVPRETMIEAKGKGKLQTFWMAPEVDLSFTAKSHESRAYRHGRASSVADSEDDEDRATVNRAVSRLVKNLSSRSLGAKQSSCKSLTLEDSSNNAYVESAREHSAADATAPEM